MAKVGNNEQSERNILEAVKPMIDVDGQNLLGWNEDAIASPSESGYIVLNTDSWVASTDRPTGLPLFNCGYRALINSASDVVAKGAVPKHAVVSLSIPKTDYSHVPEILRGVAAACQKYKISYLGGDLNSANDLVIDVTTWGYSREEELIPRNRAKVGEFIYWIGPNLGELSVALGILTNRIQGDRKKAIELYGDPVLYLGFLDYQASAAIDCSDGLASSLYQLSAMSKVGIEINKIKVDKWVEETSSMNNTNVIDHVFYGGEELGILFTSANEYDETENLQLLGTVIAGSEVRFMRLNLENKGWDHFSL